LSHIIWFLLPVSQDVLFVQSSSTIRRIHHTMSAVAKGKGKAFIPSGPIVIDSDEDDDEDPLAYFTFKRKPNQPLGKLAIHCKQMIPALHS